MIPPHRTSLASESTSTSNGSAGTRTAEALSMVASPTCSDVRAFSARFSLRYCCDSCRRHSSRSCFPATRFEKTLSNALASAFAQTYSNWECVCLRDGSTDGTWEILQAAQARDSHFRIECFPTNQGRGAARERTLEQLKGDLITFLDADGFMYPNKLSTMEAHPHIERLRRYLARHKLDDGRWQSRGAGDHRVPVRSADSTAHQLPSFDRARRPRSTNAIRSRASALSGC